MNLIGIFYIDINLTGMVDLWTAIPFVALLSQAPEKVGRG